MYLLLSALAETNLFQSEQAEGVRGGGGWALINTRDSAFPVFGTRPDLAPETSQDASCTVARENKYEMKTAASKRIVCMSMRTPCRCSSTRHMFSGTLQGQSRAALERTAAKWIPSAFARLCYNL